MSDKLEHNSDIEGILFRQGKVIGHLEELQKSIGNLDTKVDRNYEATICGIKEVLIKCEENSKKMVNIHAETCPMLDKLNIHVVKHEEKEKYKKENEIKQDKIQSKKISWFKWVISAILGILGIKGVIDIIFNSSNKVTQNIDKILK